MANWFFSHLDMLGIKKQGRVRNENQQSIYNDICWVVRLCMLIRPQCHHINTYKAYIYKGYGEIKSSTKKRHGISEVRNTNIYTQTRSHIDNKFIYTCDKVSWDSSSVTHVQYTPFLLKWLFSIHCECSVLIWFWRPQTHIHRECVDTIYFVCLFVCCEHYLFRAC